jgi:hypothetical protein
VPKPQLDGTANANLVNANIVVDAVNAAEILAQQSEALLAYTQSTISPGEQIMFAIDMPDATPQQLPPGFVQVAGKTPNVKTDKPNYVIFEC